MPPKRPALRHLGIIMDGNRRWAKAKGVSVSEGHQAGYQALKALLPAFKSTDIEYVTVYSFSTENWSRSRSEIKGLMSLLKWVINKELGVFTAEGIRLRIIGSRDGLSADIIKLLAKSEQETASNKNATLVVCFNYGGQQEIADAVKQLVAKGVNAADITPELLAKNLYAADIPPLDLVIRTAGEKRLSNFMLWRAAYSEFVFIDKFWPDFTPADLAKVLADYTQRERRFGK